MNKLARRIQGPVAVIGDVHGQLREVEIVLDRLRHQPDFQRRAIVFIGDLIDRGPDSRGVLDLVCDLIESHPVATVVCGNHELAMAGALGLIPTPEYSNWSQRWVSDYVSEPTFESFGLEHGDLIGLCAGLSERHHSLLSDLPWCVEHPDFLFVHAGLDPNTPFDMQMRILRERDYSLNRPPWLCSKSFVSGMIPRDCPKTVVSGHVQVPNVMMEDRRLLIDTTGGNGGDLSCVLLPEARIISSGNNPDPQPVPGGSRTGKSWWRFWAHSA